jgi:PQQ-dependent dehydrogenase (methanol/ethanol family)
MRGVRRLVVGAAVLAAVAALAGAAGGQEQDEQTLLANGDWPAFGGTFEQDRHSPLQQITPENVGQLGRVFSVDFREIDPTIPPQQQTYPVVVDGVIYATTSYNHVFAIDGKTGKVLWHYKPEGIDFFRNFGLNPNRGVAYCDGKIFELRLDMQIVSLDAQTGELLQQVPISDAVPGAKPQLGYFNTAAPICYRDILLVGTSGADFGIRGFVMAYHASDLSPAWPNPVWTVPPEGQGWRTAGRFHGGGSVAMPVTVDPQTNTVFIPVGVPSPVYYPSLRPGPNPKTDSLVAVDLATGKQKWWQQQLAGDQWNYDTFASPLVFDATVGGEERRVVTVATKEGVMFVYDAETGEPIYERIKLIDRIEHPSLRPGKPVTIYPSSLGGVNYSTSSFDPDTNYEIVAAAETAAVLTQAKTAKEIEENRIRGDLDLGLTSDAFFGVTPEGWKDTGSVVAVNLENGEIAWKFRTPEPERGGVTTTASGLGFVGGGDGVLRAFDTKTGKVLWEFQTGNQIAAAPAVYEVDGEEYVAIAVGGTFTSSFGGTASRLDVFALGGDKTQSEPPRLTPEPPPEAGTEEPSAYLSLGDEPKTLKLQVVSAPGKNGEELDGERNGGLSLSVPQGWTVHVTYVNHDPDARHSLVLGTEKGAARPVFRGATTENPERGTAVNEPQYFSFEASERGSYVLGSAVPGDAAAGEWATVRVVGPNAIPKMTLGDETFSLPPEEG